MAYTTINKSTDYFNTKLYSGTGADNNAITGVGFQPDFTWLKSRSVGEGHYLQDAVRGATKHLHSQNTDAEATQSNALKSFNSDGFTVGDEADINTNNSTNVSWNWKAGGTASTNNDGSTACSLSANATSGFSISTHTVPSGDYTIGHGLGKKPKLVITKHTSTTGNFQTYFEGIGTENQQYLQLNTTAALANHSGLWGTGMTTSVVGLSNTALSAGTTAITYSFAEIPGYSKFGKYTGNANADGTFVYTGFKPKFLLVKRTDTADWWGMFDDKREGYNPSNSRLFPNDSGAENASSFRLDMLSNGFKLRSSDGDANENGNNFLFMAFAEHPLVASNGTPATAR